MASILLITVCLRWPKKFRRIIITASFAKWCDVKIFQSFINHLSCLQKHSCLIYSFLLENNISFNMFNYAFQYFQNVTSDLLIQKNVRPIFFVWSPSSQNWSPLRILWVFVVLDSTFVLFFRLKLSYYIFTKTPKQKTEQ